MLHHTLAAFYRLGYAVAFWSLGAFLKQGAICSWDISGPEQVPSLRTEVAALHGHEGSHREDRGIEPTACRML